VEVLKKDEEVLEITITNKILKNNILNKNIKPSNRDTDKLNIMVN